MSVALNVLDLVFGNSYALLIDNRLRHFFAHLWSSDTEIRSFNREVYLR